MASTDDPLGDCLAAVKVAWDADPTLAGISGPHLFEKPPKQVPGGFPYAVVTTEISVQDGWTCDNELWDNGLTIWIYQSTPELALSGANLVRAIFAPESLALPLANGSVVRKRIEQAQLEQLDETVFRAGVPISLYTRRPRVKAA